MIKVGIILTIIAVCFFGILLVHEKRELKKSASPTMAILQTASHPALDQVRESFIRTILQQNKHVHIISHNAEGSVSHAHTIAKSLQSNANIDAFFTIATLATQVMTHLEKQRPIIFAAVTNPEELGLQIQQNVCGVTDMTDITTTVTLIHTLIPTIKRVAILFNTSEINSIAMVKWMHENLQKTGIDFIDIGITSEAEVPSAVLVACKKADVILTPLDNIVASSIQLLAQQALHHKTPLIVSDNLLVKHGATAACGVDYTEIGKLAASNTLQIINNEKNIREINITKTQNNKIIINKNSCKELNIAIPKELETSTFDKENIC